MKGEDRKAAIKAYKERKLEAGIYAVRCAAAGATWVGQTPNLDTVRNRIWFGLRLGSSPHKGLLAAWRTHGPDSLAFEVVERLPEEDIPYVRAALLKERLAHWKRALGADTI